MTLTPNELLVLRWSDPCAVVWPTEAADPLYVAGRSLERAGLVTNVQHSPELWKITPSGRAVLDGTDQSDAQRADEAMRRIWSEWFQYYDRHFRGPGIAISMADQQAFFEIAQPIMQNLVNGGQSPSK